MKIKLKTVSVIFFSIILCYALYSVINPQTENQCKLSGKRFYENTSKAIVRKDIIALLFINDGTVKEMRFYEIDDSGNKIGASGYSEVSTYTSKNGFSCGNLEINFSINQAEIMVHMGKKHNIRIWKLPQLYCQSCIDRIKCLNKNLDVALVDFTDHRLYDISEKSHFWIRNYEVITEPSEEVIKIRVKYYPEDF